LPMMRAPRYSALGIPNYAHEVFPLPDAPFFHKCAADIEKNRHGGRRYAKESKRIGLLPRRA
jgi:hypothetical protein